MAEIIKLINYASFRLDRKGHICVESINYVLCVTICARSYGPNWKSPCEMKWNETYFSVWGAQKANGTESISWWFQTSSFYTLAECSSLREIGAYVNLLV